MWRMVVVYGLALALGALMLDWLDYKHLVRDHSTAVYVSVVALLFAAIGLWLGLRLTLGRRDTAFERNVKVMATLGISERECEVLELISAGYANKTIARTLRISPNTVKTHVARLFEKLEVANRTQAIRRARELEILP